MVRSNRGRDTGGFADLFLKLRGVAVLVGHINHKCFKMKSPMRGLLWWWRASRFSRGLNATSWGGDHPEEKMTKPRRAATGSVLVVNLRDDGNFRARCPRAYSICDGVQGYLAHKKTHPSRTLP